MKKFGSVDDILDFAITREIEAHDFYLELANYVEEPEMAEVLSDLASVELRHKQMLESVKAGNVVLDPEEINGLGLAEKVKEIEPDAKMDYLELLVVGMKKEEQSRLLYTNLASIARNQQIKDIFLKLAREEAAHKLRFEIEYELRTF
jgi:rubrerythrin